MKTNAGDRIAQQLLFPYINGKATLVGECHNFKNVMLQP